MVSVIVRMSIKIKLPIALRMFIEAKAVDKELFALVFINFLPEVV